MNRKFAATLLIVLAIAFVLTQMPTSPKVETATNVEHTSQVEHGPSFAQLVAQDGQVDGEQTSGSPSVGSLQISSGSGGFLRK